MQKTDVSPIKEPDIKEIEMKIPYTNLSQQALEEKASLKSIFDQVLASGRFIGGSAIESFEKNIAKYTNTVEAIALNSGTDALCLAMKVSGIGAGDEVITPPNPFVASTAAITHLGAKPVFVDVAPDQNIDPTKIEQAITPRTKAIMPVHLTGRMCAMDQIEELADHYGLTIVEDGAQSIGSKFKGRSSGAIGDFGCFSAHPLKNLNAIGDGGYIVTNKVEIAARLRRLRNHGLRNRVDVDEWGGVSRMDTLKAAILDYRLQKLETVIAKRRQNAAFYHANLGDLDIFMPEETEDQFNTYHTFVIQLDRRDELQAYLKENGIGSSIHYPIPIHLQPAAKELGYVKGDFPATEAQAERILSLPINQHIGESELAVICSTIRKFMKS